MKQSKLSKNHYRLWLNLCWPKLKKNQHQFRRHPKSLRQLFSSKPLPSLSLKRHQQQLVTPRVSQRRKEKKETTETETIGTTETDHIVVEEVTIGEEEERERSVSTSLSTRIGKEKKDQTDQQVRAHQVQSR